MEYVEKWGNTEEEAIELALSDLKVSKEEVEVEILEESSKGFLGIGKKLAKVRVSKKSANLRKVENTQVKLNDEKIADKAESHRSEKTATKNIKKSDKPDKSDKKEVQKKVSKKEEKLEDNKTQNFKDVDDTPALNFIKDVVEKMGIDVQISAKASEEGDIYVDIEGKDSACVIGKRGQTLDALQYLTRVAINKGDAEYTNIIVDAGKYRARREKTLVQLAKRLADKAIRTKRPVRLEPMSSYERKIIHSALQENKKVVTRSEGKEPYRRVVIETE